mmetsp:Transcript_16474/g.25830  ORF Transcript_16474/g.25830 Transcript_16474/m.25830 type:complete len:254 (+) Transcript_16474:54-815(+)
MRMSRSTVVLFGDSITQMGFGGDSSIGWAGLLANAYTRRADVLNRGYSGYNTRFAMDILPSVFGSGDDDVSSYVGRPLFVTVFFGANDASLPGDRDQNQHVPIDEYEGSLRKIVQSIGERFQADKPAVLVITPPPVAKNKWDGWCMENFGDLSPRTNEVSKLYGDRAKSVAKELGCSVVDSFSLLGGNDTDESYGKHLEDGLHLNGSGNKLLFEGLMDVLKRDFPELAPMDDRDDKNGKIGIALHGALWKEFY